MLTNTAQNPNASMDQARADVSRLLDQATPDDLVVMVGIGSGLHAKAIAEAERGPKLVVYENRPIIGEGVLVCNTLEKLAEAISEHVVYGPNGRVAVYPAPGGGPAIAETIQTVRQLVSEIMGRAKVDNQTRRQKNMLWAEYIAQNASALLASPDVTRWQSALAGVPALIIGAGPSLSDDLERISALDGKALFMGAASILGPLAEAGISPHCVTALEAKDESRQFVGLDMDQTLLAAASNSHPNHFAAWPGMLGHFHLVPWVAEAFGAMALPNGGHATSAAFTLALVWGCDPIILVGQDLAYSGGRVHAQGRIGGEDDPRQQNIEVPAIGGGTVLTSPVFHSYISWYQESAGYLARSKNPTRIINSTSQGALIPGMRHMPLDSAAEFCADVTFGRHELNNIYGGAAKPGRKTVSQGLQEAAIQVTRAIEAGPPAAMRGARPGSAVAYAAEGLTPGELAAQLPGRLKELLDLINTAKGVVDNG